MVLSPASLVFLAVLIFTNGVPTEAKVVALFSVPHAANVRTHTNVGRSLTALGHDAYVCIPQFMLDNNMVNVEGVKVISYGDYLGNTEEVFLSSMVEDFWEGHAIGMSKMMKLTSIFNDMIHQLLSDKVLIKTLNKIKPDLFVITAAPPFLNFVVFPYMLGVPFAYMSPFADLPMYRVPFSPPATACQAVPSGFSQRDMSFMTRLKNTICNVMIMVSEHFIADNNLIAEFAPHRPQISVLELARQAEIYLVEGDYILDFAKPELPNTKLIGCTAPTPSKPLKEPFKSFIERSKNGVAVVTFGSAVVNIPDPIARKMASAFQKQGLDVIWRANFTSLDPKKILTSLWVPQNDILAHEKTKLFVSHCGANGQYEALYHGVPILCFPIFGDQPYNAQRTTSKGYGLQGNILDVSEKELIDLMEEVSGNERYRSTIKRASGLFRKLFKIPDKEAAFWIDHVLEYGGSYMRSAGQDMPLYQFLALDIMAFIGLVVAIFVVVVYGLISCCCGLIFRCFRVYYEKSKRSKMD